MTSPNPRIKIHEVLYINPQDYYKSLWVYNNMLRNVVHQTWSGLISSLYNLRQVYTNHPQIMERHLSSLQEHPPIKPNVITLQNNQGLYTVYKRPSVSGKRHHPVKEL